MEILIGVGLAFASAAIVLLVVGAVILIAKAFEDRKYRKILRALRIRGENLNSYRLKRQGL